MSVDVVRLAMLDAVVAFGHGGPPGVFNAAGFGLAFCRRAGVQGSLDGKLVRAILSGRSDVKVLAGGAHFRLHLTAIG